MDSLSFFSVPWILAFCAVLFAAFIRGVSGFGLSVILAPIMLLIINSKAVVPVNVMLAALSNIIVVSYSIRNLNFRAVLPMAVCNLAGIPLGLWILTIIEPSTLKILIGGVTILFTIPLAIGITRVFTRERLASGVAGFFSGVIGTATSLGGPPVVLFMHNQDWPKEKIHSGLATYFMITAPFTIVALALAGLIDTQTVALTASLAPAMFLGIFLGILAFRRINARFFRGLSLAVIIGAGAFGIISGLGLLS
jgi:uncharacterized membrane protein YfcA